jgi:hypothetical protein
MNILLIGGKGFLGRRLLNALTLSAGGDFRVTIGSRRNDKDQIAINLNEPADYPRLREFDAVINCAAIRPEGYEPLIRYCLNAGVRLLETTADPSTIRLLIQLKDQLGASHPPATSTGLFLFGVGIFPGVSNLLISQVISDNPGAQAVNLGIQYKVMSGAGRGMCHLMVDTIGSPCHWFEQGQEHESAVPFFSLGHLTFRTRPSAALQLTIGELYTMHSLLPSGSARSYISFRPTWLNRPCYYLFNTAPYLGIFKKPALRLLFSMFYFVRGILLRNHKTDIRLLCTAPPSRRVIWFNDAFLAAGFFTVALLRQLQTTPAPGGCHAVEDIYTLDTILPLMARLGNKTLQYEYA